jgi:hypothetical protein
MENEEQNAPEENIEIPAQKPKSKMKLISALVVVSLGAWFVSNQMSTGTNLKDYASILASSSKNFYAEFQPGAITTELNINIGGDINDDEQILIYRNLDLATSYLGESLKEKTIWIDIFDDPQKLKVKLLKDIAVLGYESGLEEDVMPGGFFMDNLDCDSNGTIGMTYSDYWEDPAIVILANCGWEEKGNDEYQIYDTDVFSHELVHVSQEEWFGMDHTYSYCFVPKWYSEGQAQFVSSLISTIDGTLDPKYFRTAWLDYLPDGNLTDDESYESDQGPYSDGAFAMEYLVGVYGWDMLAKLVDNLNIVKTSECEESDVDSRFSAAFEKTFNITLEKFYADVKPYIKWNIEKLD